MRMIAISAALVLLHSAAAAAETRCGRIVNLTPHNWWLNDVEGEWIISSQGGERAEGMDLLPDFTTGDWIATNGPVYGFGCACMRVDTERAALNRITRIYSVEQLRMRKCDGDPKLRPRGD